MHTHAPTYTRTHIHMHTYTCPPTSPQTHHAVVFKIIFTIIKTRTVIWFQNCVLEAQTQHTPFPARPFVSSYYHPHSAFRDCPASSIVSTRWQSTVRVEHSLWIHQMIDISGRDACWLQPGQQLCPPGLRLCYPATGNIWGSRTWGHLLDPVW